MPRPEASRNATDATLTKPNAHYSALALCMCAIAHVAFDNVHYSHSHCMSSTQSLAPYDNAGPCPASSDEEHLHRAPLLPRKLSEPRVGERFGRTVRPEQCNPDCLGAILNRLRAGIVVEIGLGEARGTELTLFSSGSSSVAIASVTALSAVLDAG